MFTLRADSEQFRSLNDRCKELVLGIVKDLEPEISEIKVPGDQALYSSEEDRNAIYLVREGVLKHSDNGKVLYFFDQGDLIGTECPFITSHAQVSTESGAMLDRYAPDDFYRHIQHSAEVNTLWNEYTAYRWNLSVSMLSSMVTEALDTAPLVRSFKKGETIITQGDPAKEVYTLVKGKAEVFVDEFKVGEVLANEIFGAMAVLTEKPRTATVIACEDTLIFALPGLEFVKLIHSRPATVLKMIQDMARVIVQMNDTLVEVSTDPLFLAVKRSLT